MERLYGIKKGGNHGNQYIEAKGDNPPLATQEQLAEQIGISQDQLKMYKKLLNLIPELQDLVEKDKLSATTAYKVYARTLINEKPSN